MANIPNFNINPANNKEIEVLASECKIGNQSWRGKNGILIAKLNVKRNPNTNIQVDNNITKKIQKINKQEEKIKEDNDENRNR